jgi:inosose dehydratase
MIATVAPLAAAADPAGETSWRFGPLGCRMANYGKYDSAGWTHLPSTGLHYVFLPVPALDEVETIRHRLAAHGLKVAVMRGVADLSTPTSVDSLASQLDACQRMGVHHLFLSPKHPGVSREDACVRLRRGGDLAMSYGVTLVLETHPDLGVNADEHLLTMKQIHHPNVRVNFDTGNITFYNKGLNAVDELLKVIDYVATVEIKDHNGKPAVWNFPALGRGVVDIPGVLRVLEEHRFRGPITIEVEGVQGISLTEEQTKQNIAESVAYLLSQAKFE